MIEVLLNDYSVKKWHDYSSHYSHERPSLEETPLNFELESLGIKCKLGFEYGEYTIEMNGTPFEELTAMKE